MIYVSQNDLEMFQLQASMYIKHHNTNNDAIIVGVSRGGLIPAVYVSHMSDLPMIPIDYSAEQGRGTSKHTNIIPPLDKYQTVFIIDDIVDTGITIKHLKEWFEQKGHDVHVLSVVYKETSCIEPDSYFLKLNSTEWIVFPWEKEAYGQKESEKVKTDEGSA